MNYVRLKIDGVFRWYKSVNDELISIEKQLTGWEKTEKGEKYFCISDIHTKEYTEVHHNFDNTLFESANYFCIRDLAINFDKAQKIFRKLWRWQAEHDISIRRDSSVNVYTVSWDPELKHLCTAYGSALYSLFEPVFSTREVAEECIEVFRDDLEWLYKEFKTRMDEDYCSKEWEEK